MIATIIPFLLLANLPEETTWQNGPEYKFTLNTKIDLSKFNNTYSYGINATNDLTCRPKLENTLSCCLKNINLTNYELKKDTGELKTENINRNETKYFDTIVFEIEFDSKGVRKMVLSEEASNDSRGDVIKFVANLLNVGMDLRKLTFNESNNKIIMDDTHNYLLGECPAAYNIGITKTSRTTQNDKWILDLVPPLKKLSEHGFHVTKNTFNTTDCKFFEQFFWSTLVMDNYKNYEEFNTIKVTNRMSIYKDEFRSRSSVILSGYYEHRYPSHYETVLLVLDEIRPTQGDLPEIKDSVTILFSNSDENAN